MELTGLEIPPHLGSPRFESIFKLEFVLVKKDRDSKAGEKRPVLQHVFARNLGVAGDEVLEPVHEEPPMNGGFEHEARPENGYARGQQRDDIHRKAVAAFVGGQRGGVRAVAPHDAVRDPDKWCSVNGEPQNVKDFF